jgi:hypothetical protein
VVQKIVFTIYYIKNILQKFELTQENPGLVKKQAFITLMQ